MAHAATRGALVVRTIDLRPFPRQAKPGHTLPGNRDDEEQGREDIDDEGRPDVEPGDACTQQIRKHAGERFADDKRILGGDELGLIRLRGI